MTLAYLIDSDTKESLEAVKTDWKFEEGQVFESFWGCKSTVTKVKLDMRRKDEVCTVPNERIYIVQFVEFKREPLNI